MPGVFVSVAIATFLVPLAFLALLVPAALRRARDEAVGARLTSALTFAGSLSLGVFAIAGSFSLPVLAPIVVAGVATVATLWRSRRRRQAGLALVGLGLPSLIATPFGGTVPFGLPIRAGADDAAGFGAVITILGASSVVAGIVLLARGDPAEGAADRSAAVGQPGSRRIGNVARAILEPASAGPFSLPAVASLVAYVATWLVVPLVVPRSAPGIVSFAAPVLIGAVLAAEAYIRSFPPRARRAFEAFSWYGDWELAAARSTTGSIPHTKTGAERWLATHPPRDGDGGVRAEILVLAERFDEARAVARALPARTPVERWQRAATIDFVDWSAGGPGDPSALRQAVEALDPGTDDRLRAEVSLATGEVRRRLADGRTIPADALDPLLAVRDRLGKRADGQLGRALRSRLIVTYAVGGALIGAVLDLASSWPPPGL